MTLLLLCLTMALVSLGGAAMPLPQEVRLPRRPRSDSPRSFR